MGKDKKPVICITGPTASGKSKAAFSLTDILPIEIVCMDSMQIFRNMDIGTAKPTLSEQQSIPHHMIDIINPGDPFSAAEYADKAKVCISAIHSRSCIPVLVGGTGLYLRSISYPMSFGGSKRDEEIRMHYSHFAETNGRQALHKLLAEKDPVSASRLPVNDVRRIVRALEVWELTGIPFSAQTMPDDSESPYVFFIYALDIPRETLYERINIRVGVMIKQGLLSEVEWLLNAGVPADAQSMQGLGYKEMIPVIQGDTALDTAVENIKKQTRNYAKRQITWFRNDKRVQWLNLESEPLADRIIKDMRIKRDDMH